MTGCAHGAQTGTHHGYLKNRRNQNEADHLYCNRSTGGACPACGRAHKKIKEFQCAATISKDDKTADARKMFAVPGLGIKCGESITLTFDGADEEQAASALAQTLAEHF